MHTAKLYFSVVCLMALTISSCKKKEEPIPIPDPVADFSMNTPIRTGEVMFFENESTDAWRYEWDFGDGTSSTITLPSHRYEMPGTYMVSLLAFSRNDSVSSSESKTVSVG